MSVGSASTASTTTPTTETKKQGFEGLTADDFFKLLIAQLQSQDPTEPVSNEQLLNQLATMRGLQSNVEMSSTLKDLAATLKSQQGQSSTPFADSAGQKLSVGTSFIGQQVTFADSTTGVVTAAQLRDGKVLLIANGREIGLDQLQSVNSPQALVNQLVSGTGLDADGNSRRVVGYATNVLRHDERDFLQVSQPDNSGQLQPIGEIPFERVENAFSYDTLIGRYVQARTTDGVEIFGVATAPKAGAGDKLNVIVGKENIPIKNIIGFPPRASLVE